MKAEESAQLIPLVIWLLLQVLTGCATLTAGYLCLRSKDSDRTKLIDKFLILATATVALGYVGDLMPHDKINTKNKTQENATSTKDLDILGNRLNEFSYRERLPQPFLFITEREGTPTFKEALTRVQEYLEDQLKRTPNDIAIKAKLTILKHENGKKVEAVPDASPLIRSLQNLYTASKENVLPGTEAILQDNFANNWYRTQALKFFYQKTDSPKFAAFTRDQEKIAQDYNLRMQWYYALRLIFCGLGLFAIFYFFSSRSKNKLENAPRYFPFRNWYGCALALFCTPIFLGIPIAFAVSFVAAIAHMNLSYSSLAPLTFGLCPLAGMIVFAICVNLFILRPADIKSPLDFLAENKLAPRNFCITIFGGFCSVVAIETVLRWIVVLIPCMPTSGSNAMQEQAYEAFVASDSLLLPVLIILICTLGPVVEEILFRGLMYPWMRNKVGVLRAIILTSLIFGLWHLDLRGLIYYFAMGLALTMAFERKRNLLVTCAMHAMWNTWVMASMLITSTR